MLETGGRPVDPEAEQTIQNNKARDRTWALGGTVFFLATVVYWTMYAITLVFPATKPYLPVN